jgi:hypothetical protein
LLHQLPFRPHRACKSRSGRIDGRPSRIPRCHATRSLVRGVREGARHRESEEEDRVDDKN